MPSDFQIDQLRAEIDKLKRQLKTMRQELRKERAERRRLHALHYGPGDNEPPDSP